MAGVGVGEHPRIDIEYAIERGDEEMATLLMKRHIEENIDHIKSNNSGEL